MPTRTTILPLIALLIVAITPASSFAYVDEGLSPSIYTQCIECHGATGTPPSQSNADTRTVTGPHLGYAATSHKCDTCHRVHNASGMAPHLLPDFTIVATCQICHDGTGGKGVYGVLAARGVPANQISRHRVEATNLIPGGSSSTGGTSTVNFDPADPGRPMICTDCHSAHGADVVQAFTGDRRRVVPAATSISYPITSSRLLKRKPGGFGAGVTRYGSAWCAACHQGRLAARAGLHDHQVGNDPQGFYYQNVIRMVNDTSSPATETGTIGGTNRGYLMTQGTKDRLFALGSGAICQQCHEDARDPGTLSADASTADPTTFVVNSVDGTSAADVPRFQTFPHEVQGKRLLIEPATTTALCDNCHRPIPPWRPW